MTGTHNKNGKNKGFTLVETIIAIGLFSTLVAIAVGAFVNAIRTEREVGNLISAQSNVSLAIEQMAREARTGYLFCHKPDYTLGEQNTPDPDCGCTVNLSNNVWTCSALDFLNAQSEDVVYSNSSPSGTLMRKDNLENGGVAEPLTGDDVTVKNLQFILRGQLEGDGWSPFITVSLAISPSSTDPVVASTTLYFQTSVSSRQIDCDPVTGKC